jgi:hypothetical protein
LAALLTDVLTTIEDITLQTVLTQRTVRTAISLAVAHRALDDLSALITLQGIAPTALIALIAPT